MQQSSAMNAEARDEFTSLLLDHRRLVLKVVHMYARGGADAQDLAQEIAAQVWRAFPGYDRSRRFSTWMYRIALNVAISWLRTETPRRRHSVPFDPEVHEREAEAGADDSETDERQRILRGFIATQEPLNRAVLLLYLEEHSYAEMSEILGVSETSLTTKIGRLKERLRTYAEKHHGTR